MAKWDGVITNGGNSLLNSWVTGKTLHFDHAAAGTGIVADIPLMAQTALVNQKQIAKIVKAEEVPEGKRLTLQVTPIETGYKLNQFGVWASVDGGAAVMLAIFQHKDGIPIPSEAETPDFVYTFYALVSCDNTGEWTVNLDTSAIVTHGEMEEAIDEAVATKQDKITVVGVLKGDGAGVVSAAVAGTDYGYPLLKGSGAPAKSTAGETGQHYLDTTHGKEYICKGKNGSNYTWGLAGASDAADLTYGDKNLDDALDDLTSDLDDAKSDLGDLGKTVDGHNNLTGTANPTTATKGVVGQEYFNTATGESFICTATAGNTYTWKLTGRKTLYPQIVVSVATGSIVTCTNGSTTLSAASVAGKATFEVTEYGNWTVSATQTGKASNSEVIKVDAVKTYAVTLYYANVFGVCWNPANQSTALSRLTKTNDPLGHVTVNITTEPTAAVGTGSGSSPFNSYSPWKEMDEYNIVNGVVMSRKGDPGFSRSTKDTMVYIPEFWFKVAEIGGKRYFYISDKPRDGFSKHPGSGKYVGRYHATEDYMSKTGVAPIVSITRDQARQGAMAKGEKWSQLDYTTWCAVWLLYLVEFADWDSQKKIGRGYVDMAWQDGKANNGGTDTMTYHTGRAAGTDGKTCIQYRHIENIWGNIYQFVDGINFNYENVYACYDHTKYADDTDVNYEWIGETPIDDDTSGYIKALASPDDAEPWAFIPTNCEGSETTYIPDCAWIYGDYEEWYILCVGGYWSHRSYAGLFYFNADNTSDDYNSNIGARLLGCAPLDVRRLSLSAWRKYCRVGQGSVGYSRPALQANKERASYHAETSRQHLRPDGEPRLHSEVHHHRDKGQQKAASQRCAPGAGRH